MSPAMSRDVDLRDGNVWAETSAMSQELLRDIARHRHFVTTVSRCSISLLQAPPIYPKAGHPKVRPRLTTFRWPSMGAYFRKLIIFSTQ